MRPIEVKYKNRDKLGICCVLVKKSTDEVENILHNCGVAYTEIVSLDSPRIPIGKYLKEQGIDITE